MLKGGCTQFVSSIISLLELPVAADKCIGRTVMREPGFVGTLQFRNDAVGQHFPKFDAPLVERVDMPDCALHEDLMLVERDQLAQRLRCQPRCSMVFVGRLPSKVRCGTWKAGTPSAITSSAVFPNARASVWAKKFAINRSWCRPSGFSVWQKPMKSHGMSLVPW